MTTTTTEIKLIEHLDFEPNCAGSREKGVEVPCPEPARWMASMKCCGYSTFFCDEHHAYFSGEWERRVIARGSRIQCYGCNTSMRPTKGFTIWRRL